MTNQTKQTIQTKQTVDEIVDRALGKQRPSRKQRLRRVDGSSPNMSWPDLTAKGPARSYRNARVAIQALGIICKYDEFHDRMLVGGHQIGQWAGELSDAVTVVLRQVIIENFGFDPGKDHVAEAATALCLENRFDPLLDYLDGLKWDGVPRLDRWLTTYLGVEDTNLHRAVGRATLTAAVRRIRQPGCKFDHILTLEGPEGKGKSTAIAVLAGVENFSDQTILSQSDKEQQVLKSPTGNRRFWPVAVGSIDIEGLRRDRDQLWAEAAKAERDGEATTLAAELWATVADAQEARREHDPWDDLLADVAGAVYTSADGMGEEARISTEELYKTHLGIPATEKVNTVHHQRLKRAMQRLGWNGPKFIGFGGKSQKRGYFRTNRDAEKF